MEITNDVAGKRFFMEVEGGQAQILYRRGPNNCYDLYSTEVPIPARGKNIASQLVEEALQVARDEGVQVMATCPYVKRWFEKHPDQRSMIYGFENEERPSL